MRAETAWRTLGGFVIVATWVAAACSSDSDDTPRMSDSAAGDAAAGASSGGVATGGQAGAGNHPASGGRGGQGAAAGSGAGTGVVDAALDAPLTDDASQVPLTCDAIEGAWDAYVAGNQWCSTDGECAAYVAIIDPVGSETCDGPGGLMAFLRADAIAGARDFRDAYEAAECWNSWTDIGFDGLPLESPRCSLGRCTGDQPDCWWDPRDAGPDAGVAADASPDAGAG
jgi:hypothetical protein